MRILTGLAALAACWLTATTASAAALLLVNADLNAGPVADWDGGYSPGHERPLPGWTASGGSGTGHWNPTTAHFQDEAAHRAVGWTSTALSSTADTGMMAQVLADYVIAANTRYTLSLDVGRYFGQPEAAYDFGFLAGFGTKDAAILARQTGARAAGDGLFETVSLVFETGATGPAIGKSLAIGLGSSGGGIAYDNVRLEAMSLAGAVPEPASWALMIIGFGSVGAALRSRRSLALAGA